MAGIQLSVLQITVLPVLCGRRLGINKNTTDSPYKLILPILKGFLQNYGGNGKIQSDIRHKLYYPTTPPPHPYTHTQPAIGGATGRTGG